MMKQLPLAPLDMQATYRICVTGELESSWAERLWGMRSSPAAQSGEPEQTMLVGEVADQAALVGIINALYNTGHTVVSVERLTDETDSRPDEALPPDSTKEV